MINGASLRDVAAGFGFGGALGFALAMTYSCVHAMRVGLLTRFWGSLGAALGVASILFFQFTLLWFLYLGLLIAGWVPGGRPPAWQTGKAMPWPTPGERAAESLQAGEDDGGETGEGETTAISPRQPGERRKRKRRR